MKIWITAVIWYLFTECSAFALMIIVCKTVLQCHLVMVIIMPNINNVFLFHSKRKNKTPYKVHFNICHLYQHFRCFYAFCLNLCFWFRNASLSQSWPVWCRSPDLLRWGNQEQRTGRSTLSLSVTPSSSTSRVQCENRELYRILKIRFSFQLQFYSFLFICEFLLMQHLKWSWMWTELFIRLALRLWKA